jgi:hypothetical protein
VGNEGWCYDGVDKKGNQNQTEERNGRGEGNKIVSQQKALYSAS